MIFGKYINGYYKKYFWAFLIGFLALIIVDYVQLLLPDFLGTAIDNISNNIPYQNYLKDIVLKIIGIAIILFTGRFLWRVTLFHVSTDVQTDLRKKIFYKTTTMSKTNFQKNKVGELLSLMSYDIETIQDVLGFGLVMIVDTIFLGGLTLFKMFKLDWRLTLFSIIPIILIAILGGVVEKWMSYFYDKRQEKLDNLSDFAQENLSGIRVIKAFVQEGFEILEAKRLGKECKKAEVNLTRFSSFVTAAITMLIAIITVLIIGVGGYLVYLNLTGQSSNNLTAGKIVTFIGYSTNLVWPMMALGEIIVMISKANTSLKRISKLLDIPTDLQEGNKNFLSTVQGDIEFKNLSFTYPEDNKEVLKNVSFKIKHGETIGIVGRLGSGKSTLMELLIRLYNIPENTIFIDGQDIMKLKIKDVRANIAYVPQSNVLFSDTVKNNIVFSEDNYDEIEIENAALFSDIKESINRFSLGYDTIIGEKGVSLSGGQKQRLSISRAYLKNAPIMIMDDSTSSVDMKTEKTILDNIQKYRKNKTTILIASRVSTVEHLDKILVVNDGTIEAFGSHEELLKTSKTYKNMVQIQKFESHVNGDLYE